jgi:hypothetical protein
MTQTGVLISFRICDDSYVGILRHLTARVPILGTSFTGKPLIGRRVVSGWTSLMVANAGAAAAEHSCAERRTSINVVITDLRHPHRRR